MIVRAATETDVAAVAALELDAFPGDAWTVDYLEAAVRGELPTVTIRVADDGAGIVGHAIISTVYEIAELQRIASATARRRTGVATALLDDATARAAALGAERMLLEVREGNEAALALYARTGFREIDRRPRYYADGTAAIVMEKDL